MVFLLISAYIIFQNFCLRIVMQFESKSGIHLINTNFYALAAYIGFDDDVVLRHTLPVFTGLGRCPIVNWDFAGAVSIFGPDALPVVHQ